MHGVSLKVTFGIEKLAVTGPFHTRSTRNVISESLISETVPRKTTCACLTAFFTDSATTSQPAATRKKKNDENCDPHTPMLTLCRSELKAAEHVVVSPRLSPLVAVQAD